MLELTGCTGANCCATVRTIQVEGTTGGTGRQRGLDELHSQSTRRGHQLHPISEDPARVSLGTRLFAESIDLLSHRESEATVKGFQDSLLAFQVQDLESAKCIEAEAAARTQVAQLQRQIESYQNTYGQSGDMSKQLEEKESELKKLRLQVTQCTQAEVALYTELERLSTAWEALDKEVMKRSIDSAAVEDRLSKSAIEVPVRALSSRNERLISVHL